MSNTATACKIGDVVKVKQAVLDPDTEAFRIGGWQGRILQISFQEDGTNILDIEWDSLTLRALPQESIEYCEQEGLEWTRMGLYAKDLELAQARDSEEQAQQNRKKREKSDS